MFKKNIAFRILFLLFGIFISFNSFSEDKPLLIDVRTEREYQAGHLENAILVPYNEVAEKIEGIITNKEQKINLYCRSGHRAGIALNTLNSMGYKNVVNLGGYDALLNKGYKRAEN